MNVEPTKPIARQATRRDYADWVLMRLPKDRDCFFVRLTMKQGIKRDDGTWEPFTKEAADNELWFFQRKINQCVYGSAYMRHGKSLKWIDCSEGGERHGPRHHRHLCVEQPAHFKVEEFTQLLSVTWSQSRWAHKEMRIEPARNRDAVVKYITKTGGDALCISTLTL